MRDLLVFVAAFAVAAWLMCALASFARAVGLRRRWPTYRTPELDEMNRRIARRQRSEAA